MNSLLYKYFDFNENFKNSLRKGYLWFSDPTTFNDPFEFKIQVEEYLEEKDILEYFELYKRLAVNPLGPIIENFNNVLHKYRTNPEKFIELYLAPFATRIRNFGVCCFSEVNDNILMWSHYANRHTGIVVEFDRQLLDESIYKKNKSVSMTVINKVIYSKEFPIIKISSSHKRTSDEIKKVVFTKSSDWEYEKEVRIISNLTGEHQINQKCIKRLFLGHKFSNTNKLEVHKLLNTCFQNQTIKIVEMTTDDRTYSLKVKNSSSAKKYT